MNYYNSETLLEQQQEIQKMKEQNAALAATVEALKSELKHKDLIHIGFTNKSQIKYVTEDKDEGAFYQNSDHGCYIPIYMLNVHAHRVGSESKIYCTQLEQGKKIAEIRADAGRDGFIAGYMLCNDGSPLIKHNYEGMADKYHASILAGKE